MGVFRQAPLRGVATLVALLFAVALLEAAQHRASARHGYCTEHGRQIHLEGQTRGSVAPDHPWVRRDIHLHGMHDCLALSFLSQSQTSATRVQTWRLRPAKTIEPLVPADVRIHPTIALLRLSPSHSPPPQR